MQRYTMILLFSDIGSVQERMVKAPIIVRKKQDELTEKKGNRSNCIHADFNYSGELGIV